MHDRVLTSFAKMEQRKSGGGGLENEVASVCTVERTHDSSNTYYHRQGGVHVTDHVTYIHSTFEPTSLEGAV